MKTMRHVVLNIRHAVVTVLLAVSWEFAWPAVAVAQNIGEMGQAMGSQMQGLAFLVHMVVILLGFVLLVIGLVKLAHNHKNKDPIMVPIGMILVGIALMGVMAVVDMGSQTIFGSSASTSGGSQLGLSN